MNLVSKLALGTVQFGKDYGINNKRGKVPESEVFQILSLARKSQINTLDTARAYGDSERTLGHYFAKNDENKNFNVITKMPQGIQTAAQAEETFYESLNNLNLNEIYGYLFHDFLTYKQNKEVYEHILKLKKRKLIKKFGFSVYYPSEIDYLIDHEVPFDIVQFPYSIFDQRFERHFKRLHELGVEVHVRSVFLQGLVFKQAEALDKPFVKIYKKLKTLEDISISSGVSISALCLNFVVSNEYIDKVVIGIDGINNLSENIQSLTKSSLSIVSTYYRDLKRLKEDDEMIILPFNWR